MGLFRILEVVHVLVATELHMDTGVSFIILSYEVQR